MPNGDSRITNCINQSPYSSHLKERMAQYVCNSEVFLVPVLDMDGLDIARQNLE